jgi:hypothetical protein
MPVFSRGRNPSPVVSKMHPSKRASASSGSSASATSRALNGKSAIIVNAAQYCKLTVTILWFESPF